MTTKSNPLYHEGTTAAKDHGPKIKNARITSNERIPTVLQSQVKIRLESGKFSSFLPVNT
jgi:hypothetical protein